MEDIDFGKRDKRGNWKPDYKVTPNPKYIVPFEPIKLLKHIVGWNGYIFPWTFIFGLIYGSYYLTTQDILGCNVVDSIVVDQPFPLYVEATELDSISFIFS